VSDNNETWDLVIKPRSKLFSFNLREIVHYRDLILLFTKRDIATVYKQTILGPLWFVIQPVLNTIIFIFVFGSLAKLSTDGIPQVLFYFGGTMLWQFFQVNLTQVSDTFISNASLFGKVYFPRMTVPLSKLLSNGVALGIQAVTLAVIYIWIVLTGNAVRPSPWFVLVLPLTILWLSALSFGIGTIISALTTKYRDLRQMLLFGMHLWMYATPVVYPLSQIQGDIRWIMFINPVSAPIEIFRVFAFNAGDVASGLVVTSLAVTVILLFLGFVLFHRNESTFVDVV